LLSFVGIVILKCVPRSIILHAITLYSYTTLIVALCSQFFIFKRVIFDYFDSRKREIFYYWITHHTKYVLFRIKKIRKIISLCHYSKPKKASRTKITYFFWLVNIEMAWTFLFFNTLCVSSLPLKWFEILSAMELDLSRLQFKVVKKVDHPPYKMTTYLKHQHMIC
jgi:hypothetical protein